MLLREFSTVMLSPSQSHYFPRELQAIPLLQLTYCNRCKMRLHHKLAGNVPLHSTLFSVSLSLSSGTIGTVISRPSWLWHAAERVINRGWSVLGVSNLSYVSLTAEMNSTLKLHLHLLLLSIL